MAKRRAFDQLVLGQEPSFSRDMAWPSGAGAGELEMVNRGAVGRCPGVGVTRETSGQGCFGRASWI